MIQGTKLSNATRMNVKWGNYLLFSLENFVHIKMLWLTLARADDAQFFHFQEQLRTTESLNSEVPM